jgi:energy-converting hydrogenase Eha subunit E
VNFVGVTFVAFMAFVTFVTFVTFMALVAFVTFVTVRFACIVPRVVIEGFLTSRGTEVVGLPHVF